MTANPSFQLSKMSLIFLWCAMVGRPLVGQQTPTIRLGNAEVTGLPDDWTHHHLVFPNPGTADKRSTVAGTRVAEDCERSALRDAAVEAAASRPGFRGGRCRGIEQASKEEKEASQSATKSSKPKIQKDWSMVLGSGSTTVGPGMYPAKFSFNPIGTPNCANATSPDFVVYNTSVTGSASQASIVAYDNLYSSCTGQVPSVYWAFNTGGKVTTSVVLSLTGSQVAFVQTPSSGNAQLVLLKWAPKPAGRNSPVEPRTYTAAARFIYDGGSHEYGRGSGDLRDRDTGRRYHSDGDQPHCGYTDYRGHRQRHTGETLSVPRTPGALTPVRHAQLSQ